MYFKLKLYNPSNNCGFNNISSGSINNIYFPLEILNASTHELYTPELVIWFIHLILLSFNIMSFITDSVLSFELSFTDIISKFEKIELIYYILFFLYIFPYLKKGDI